MDDQEIYFTSGSVESKALPADNMEGQIEVGSEKFFLLKRVVDSIQIKLSLNRKHIAHKVICNSPHDIEIHYFCDASQLTYGAVVYVRSTGQGETHMVM